LARHIAISNVLQWALQGEQAAATITAKTGAEKSQRCWMPVTYSAPRRQVK
jgi:hypothetical protein